MLEKYNCPCNVLNAWIGLWLIVSVTLLNGCAGSPAQRIDQHARDFGFERRVIIGRGFSHVVYLNHSIQQRKVLHVYLEGDGTPWLFRYFVATDPTPRNPVMLYLMALDGTPSIYLGRPCYHGLGNQSSCHSEYWTHGRYSPRVVDSMESVLTRLIEPLSITGIYFFGHSGGGTLAMLLAERFSQTRGVVTLAGNLDPDAWTRHHDYIPLYTSLNPARRPALDERIFQLHFLGEQDENIPPRLSYAALAQQKYAEIRLISDFDHICCWHRLWPEVLDTLPDD